MQRLAPYDAREISNFLLRIAKEEAKALTQMSLLKIVYYAHGWYLATFGQPLVKQPVEAWEHGPVIKVVYDAFKVFGKRDITGVAERLDLETGELERISDQLAPQDEAFVKKVFSTYSKYDGLTLSDMTHERGSPWDKVWNSRSAVGRLGLRIKNDEIRAHFLEGSSAARN